MPPLIRFLLKWSLIGMAAGWLFTALLLYADVSGVRGMLGRAESPHLWVFVLGFSFGITFAQVTVLAAVLLRDDFGGRGIPATTGWNDGAPEAARVSMPTRTRTESRGFQSWSEDGSQQGEARPRQCMPHGTGLIRAS